MSRIAAPQIPPEEIARQAQVMEEIAGLETRPKSYHIATYGCQMNTHDSETLAGMLTLMGMEEAPSREGADLILFNTCCIRENAERKALGNMTWLKQLKVKRPDMVLCVCGCMMQQAKMAPIILRQYPFFDVAFGTHNLYRFPSLLLRALETRRQVVEVQDTEGTIAEDLPIRRTDRRQAYVTIMYGCDNFCSYCIVPYVRGRERSRGPDVIVREVEALLEDGVREIMLLGQNVNSYGNDIQGDASFPTLLRRLSALGVPRIRFMTSHPKDLSDDLIAAMAECDAVCRHIHLPVQAGGNRILSAMNRVYTREDYLERVAALRRAIPNIALTTDFIVGFPGETEVDFRDTLSLVRQVRYDAAYTFVYSPREGTRAARMENTVPSDVATDRIARLIAAQEAVTAEIYADLVGTRQTVLVEDVSKRHASQVSGKCDRGVTCNFEGDASLIGRFAPVVITAAGHNTLKATMEPSGQEA